MKKFICGILIGSICTLAVGSVASGIWDNISVLKNDINVVVNGVRVTSDNFLYNDTTYLPLRAVSEALGKSVIYNETTNTAYIGESEVSLMNNINKFEGKYDPKNYEKVLSDNGLEIDYGFSIVLINNKYYILEMDCGYFLENNGISVDKKYDVDAMSVVYTTSYEQVTLELMLNNDNERTYVSFDTFVDEILPLVGIDPSTVI